MRKETYTGLITLKDYGEASDVLFLGNDEEPLAERLMDDMCRWGRALTVSYFISDEPRSKEELVERLVQTVTGVGSAVYADRYSETTGYLWTDEEIQVGGHDLLAEISQPGMYLHMEIDFS